MSVYQPLPVDAVIFHLVHAGRPIDKFQFKIFIIITIFDAASSAFYSG